MRLLALSPHLDDVAFSCGGTVAAFAARGWDCAVSTVFTASVPDPQGFALACQLDKGLGPEVDYMALRREEDRHFAALVGARPVHLGLAEAPHRGYGSARELFGPPRDDDVATVLASALDKLLEAECPDLVLAPQGVGGHVDHLSVVHALTRRPLAAPVLVYRDLPYGLRKRSHDTEEELVLPLDDDAVARKLDGAAAYGSQLGFQFGGETAMRAALGAAARDGERFRGASAAVAVGAPVGAPTA